MTVTTWCVDCGTEERFTGTPVPAQCERCGGATTTDPRNITSYVLSPYDVDLLRSMGIAADDDRGAAAVPSASGRAVRALAPGTLILTVLWASVAIWAAVVWVAG